MWEFASMMFRECCCQVTIGSFLITTYYLISEQNITELVKQFDAMLRGWGRTLGTATSQAATWKYNIIIQRMLTDCTLSLNVLSSSVTSRTLYDRVPMSFLTSWHIYTIRPHTAPHYLYNKWHLKPSFFSCPIEIYTIIININNDINNGICQPSANMICSHPWAGVLAHCNVQPNP